MPRLSFAPFILACPSANRLRKLSFNPFNCVSVTIYTLFQGGAPLHVSPLPQPFAKRFAKLFPVGNFFDKL
jgi:hypothetical protein